MLRAQACGPLSRTMLRRDGPGGLEMAAMVSAQSGRFMPCHALAVKGGRSAFALVFVAFAALVFGFVVLNGSLLFGLFHDLLQLGTPAGGGGLG